MTNAHHIDEARLGIMLNELRLPTIGTVQSQTAGGVVQGLRVQADLQLDGGVRAERLRLTALPGLAAPLLGMDVLGRMRWQQEAGVLRVDLREAN